MSQKMFPHLFSPITVRGIEIKNRVVASCHSGGPNLYQHGDDGFSNLTETAALYFGAIARGGAGIVNTGHLGVDPRYYLGTNREHFNFFSKETIHEHQLPVMHMMTDMIHAYGAIASMELNHPGHYGAAVKEDMPLLGPMDCVLEDGRKVAAMDEAEMDRVAEYFAEAAFIGKRGGFDMINVHAAHNWLLGMFFSPINNKRTDAYGGNVEGRARFPLMVLKRIREKIGNEMLISVRFSASELLKDGITMDDAIATINMIKEYADIVQCSAGKIHNYMTTSFLFPMQYMEHGCNTYLAQAVRACVDGVKIETVGGINDPVQADQLIADGVCDFVAMARSFIADPNWAKKAHDGHPEDIRPCIRCLRCLSYSSMSTLQTGTSICTVNPRRVLPHPLPASEIPFVKKRVAVIGGGPAGMQAAHELAAKGHDVVLYEKSGKLGGRLEFADHINFKEDVARYRKYLEIQVSKHPNLEVHLNTEATPEQIKAEGYDAVVVAIGSDDVIPPIPGIRGDNVRLCTDIYGKEDTLGDKIVIVGGGTVSCETTVHLQAMGKRVDVVEMADKLMPAEKQLWDERRLTIFFMQHEFDMHNHTMADVPEIDRVRIFLQTRCVEIMESGVIVEDSEGKKQTLEADTVLIAAGFRAKKDMAAAYRDCALDVISVGDCKRVGSIMNCSSTGLGAAMSI